MVTTGRSSTSVTRALRTRLRRAAPPADDPRLRHEQQSRDRKSGGPEDHDQAERRRQALEYVRAMPVADPHEPVPAQPGVTNWVQLGPMAIPNGQTYGGARVLVTGRVTAIVVDPTSTNVIYVGAAQGGVWKSIDGGKHWTPKSDNEVSLAVGAIAMDPTSHNVLYVGTGEGNFSGDSYYGNGVLKSTNGGDTWTLQGAAVFAGVRFCRIRVNPTNPTIVFAATTAGLFRTTNGGTTWTKLTGGLPAGAATDVAIDTTTPTTVYAAFWSQGIYKSTNASAATPTWTKLAGGLPAGGFSRIALGLSRSAPHTLYALMADGTANLINQFYATTTGGTTWSAIALPGAGNIGGQGFYNLNASVDPTTPDIVYLSATSLWKATRHPVTSAWTIVDIGQNIHPDNHAFAVDPVNHLTIYAGSDGGIYRSTNAGATWDDSLNRGMCIAQFEFMDQHPSSDAIVIAGTQDNGTEQFRNDPVFNHLDDGDGGFVAIDPNNPNNVLSTYYNNSPKRSTQAGKFGTWSSVATGIVGAGLFYPPMTLDATNPSNIAFGTDRINLDAAQGTGGWPVKVGLPGITGSVSAINYTNSNLIYVGTTSGQVYRLVRSGGAWTATALHAAPLPARWIWDVLPVIGSSNAVVVVMSGFGTAHVWRGTLAAAGPAVWTDISGTGAARLPDIPVNALAMDPASPSTMYIATDVAVFRTTNGGTTWTPFSQDLPNVAVFDMRLHAGKRLLRVATHGRGIWERGLDAPSAPNVELFVRDDTMDTGRWTPSTSSVAAAFEDPLQHVPLGSTVFWWQCADIKVDALEGFPLAYQMPVADVDYVAFEARLDHRNAQRGRVNRVYVQVHNRGIQAAADVQVKVLYANASAGLPNLPSDFWTRFPDDSLVASGWTPVGPVQTIAQLSTTEPAVLEWNWATPTAAADHTCLLVVIDSASDPIPAASKVFNVAALVTNERRVGLRNLHVVNAAPGTYYWTPLQFFSEAREAQRIVFAPSRARGWNLGLVFARDTQREPKLSGVRRIRPQDAMLEALKERLEQDFERFDTEAVYMLDALGQGGLLDELMVPPEGLQTMLLLVPPPTAVRGEAAVSVLQQLGDNVIGGSTFVLRTMKQRQ